MDMIFVLKWELAGLNL